MNSRKPKYKYGLLDTPESSGTSAFDTTIQSTSMFTEISTDNHLRKDTSATSACMLESAKANKNDESVFLVPTHPASRMTPASHCTPRTPFMPKLLKTHCAKESKTPRMSSARSTPYTKKGTPRSKPPETPKSRTTDSSVLVAMVEGRGLARGEVGMASIDLTDPVLVLSQFSDSQTYVKTITRLKVLSPVEIIFPSTVCDGGNMSKLFKVVNENCQRPCGFIELCNIQSCNITTIQRHYFNESNGLESIRRLVIKENSSVVMDLNARYYCLAASAALVKYVEFIQNTIYAAQTLRVVFRVSEQTALIDSKTASVLELVVNSKNPKSDQTLFGVLNRTKSLSGARKLRCNILQPSNDLATIQARLDCVEELTDSSDFFFGLQSVLARFEVGVDQLLSFLVQIPKQETNKTRENRITTCILLKHVTELVPTLADVLSDAKCDLFQAYKATLQDARFCSVRELLGNVLRDDIAYHKGHLNMKTERCFAVKTGVSSVLDMTRQTYTELIDDINELTRQLAAKFDLPLKSSHNASRGFYVQMPSKDAGELPGDFIQVSRTKKTINFTTDDLIELNNKMEHTINDINFLADAIVSDLLSQVRGSIGCLYNLSEMIGTLDMLLCFAHYRTTCECVRPEFTGTLGVKDARHPVLDRLRSSTFVPNNVYACDGSNFNIITGPNMSGKTTYLKSIANLQVMAQIGCFVPAEFASFRIANQIFSRIGSDDDMETNSSTFMLEMKEVNYITQNISSDSLVIIDELGRGTSSEEGVGLCWSISEFLLSQKAFTFFATHFIELCRLESVYPNVGNYHLEVKHVLCSKGTLRKVSYTYVLSKGFTKESHYGLRLAELFDFPETLTSRARAIAEKIEEKSETANNQTSAKQLEGDKAYRFATKLLQVARSSRLGPTALSDYLKSLKAAYLEQAPWSDVRQTSGDNIDHDRKQDGSSSSLKSNAPSVCTDSVADEA